MKIKLVWANHIVLDHQLCTAKIHAFIHSQSEDGLRTGGRTMCAGTSRVSLISYLRSTRLRKNGAVDSIETLLSLANPLQQPLLRNKGNDGVSGRIRAAQALPVRRRQHIFLIILILRKYLCTILLLSSFMMRSKSRSRQ